MAEDYHRIARQVGITYFFSLLIFITSPFLTSLLTRQLAISEFGAYSIFSVTISFLIVVLDLGFGHYIITKLSGKPQAMAERSMFSILAFFTGALLLLGLLIKVLGLDTLFLSLLGLPEYGKVFNVIMVIIFLCLIFRIFNSYATARKEVSFSSMMAFMNISLWVYPLAIFILVAKRLSPAIVFVTWAMGALASVIVYTIKERRGIILFLRQGRLHFDEIQTALAFGLPLVLFQTGDWLIQVADRYILKHYTNLETVGIYNLGYILVGFVIAIANVVAAVLYPYYSSSHSRNQAMRYFNIAVKYMLMLVLPAMVGLFVMRTALITLISGPAYLESATIIPWLILFPLFGSLNILLYQTMMINNRTRFIGFVYFAVGIFNIALNIALIPVLGMKGAAITTTLCYMLLFIIMAFSGRKYLDVDWTFINLKWIIIGSAVMGAVVLFINPSNLFGKIAAIFVGIVTYGLIMLITGAIGKGELQVIRGMVKGEAK